MKVQLRTGNNPIPIKGQSFGRMYLLVEGQGAMPIGGTDFDLASLRSTITIKQSGVEGTTSFNAVGPVVKQALQSARPDVYQSLNWGSATHCAGVYSPKSPLFTTIIVPLLEGGYILRGDDCIDLNIEVLSSFFSSNVSANSYVYLVTEEANGIVQTDINLPRYEPIDNSRQQVSFSYDGASEIALLTSQFYTNPVYNVEVRSSYVNDRFDDKTLQALAYTTINQTGNIGNVFLYRVEPDALYDVQINASVNTAAVETGASFLYVSTVLTGKYLTARGIAQASKIQKRNLSKRGL